MAANVEIDETNGTAPGTLTDNITNSNYGVVDSVNLDPIANPITPGVNSFTKWQQWHLVALGGSIQIENLKYFNGGGVAADTAHQFNGNTVQGSYDSTKKTVYETPDQLATDAPNTVPGSAPGSANIGIAGSLTAALTAAGRSDFVVSIITTTVSAVAGATLTITFRYDEIA